MSDLLPQSIRGRTLQQVVDKGLHCEYVAVFAVTVVPLDVRPARPAKPEAVGNGGDAPWHAGLDQWRLQVCGPLGPVKNLG